MTHTKKLERINRIICLVVSIIGIIIIWLSGGYQLLLGIMFLLWGNNIQVNMQHKDEERKKLEREFMDTELEKLRIKVKELRCLDDLGIKDEKRSIGK